MSHFIIDKIYIDAKCTGVSKFVYKSCEVSKGGGVHLQIDTLTLYQSEYANWSGPRSKTFSV